MKPWHDNQMQQWGRPALLAQHWNMENPSLQRANLNRRYCIQTARAWGTSLWHHPWWRLPGFIHYIAAIGSHGKNGLWQLLRYTPVREKGPKVKKLSFTWTRLTGLGHEIQARLHQWQSGLDKSKRNYNDLETFVNDSQWHCPDSTSLPNKESHKSTIKEHKLAYLCMNSASAEPVQITGLLRTHPAQDCRQASMVANVSGGSWELLGWSLSGGRPPIIEGQRRFRNVTQAWMKGSLEGRNFWLNSILQSADISESGVHMNTYAMFPYFVS